jgi:glycosyltransferase involved in cell wall biosynthesis
MFVDEYISEAEKSSVINECTLMLNCRLAGESFGFSICEALFLGKPIIAPSLVRNPQMDAHHIEVLNDPELLYDSSEDLVTKIQKILENPRDSETYKRKVQQFSPKKISDALFSILSFI